MQAAYQLEAEMFDQEKAVRMIRIAFDEVRAAYPLGCLDYLKRADPGRVPALKALVEEAKTTFLDQDGAGLDMALRKYRAAHLSTFEDFQRRQRISPTDG